MRKEIYQAYAKYMIEQGKAYPCFCSQEELDEKDVVWGNVIKIAILVLLGALIIYFLNKDAEVNFDLENENGNSNKKGTSDLNQNKEKNKDSEK